MTGITTSNDIITVQTGRGTQFNTRKLILTTGPWTNKILQYTGITLPLKVRDLKRERVPFYVRFCEEGIHGGQKIELAQKFMQVE